ncbi:MAG: triose-phosphate isomerase [Panacagrimonas sp.]
MKRQYLVAGNWKMNGSLETNHGLIGGIATGLKSCVDVEVLVCPPTIYLQQVKELIGPHEIAVGGQNLADQEKPGAFTGEIHGAMLREVGCSYVLVGHSERRALYGESDAIVATKFRVAQALRLTPVLCLGETLEERDGERTEAVLQRQLDAVLDLVGVEAFEKAVIAYEPVWAIGTGRTASTAQAQAAHAFLRGLMTERSASIAGSVRILYGGSVKPDNAIELFACPDVDGGLIGGASLKSGDFLAICAAAQAQRS